MHPVKHVKELLYTGNSTEYFLILYIYIYTHTRNKYMYM